MRKGSPSCELVFKKDYFIQVTSCGNIFHLGNVSSQQSSQTAVKIANVDIHRRILFSRYDL